jgi:hypothetical protein
MEVFATKEKIFQRPTQRRDLTLAWEVLEVAVKANFPEER